MNNTSFFSQHFSAFIHACWQQIYLVAIAMLVAIIVGVGLGILVSRIPKLKSGIIHIANVLQTIPSIALLGLLLPLFGIGSKPAIIALIAYALLPIIRNTITGIETIDPDLIEAANGIGFTNRQCLLLVELPLALPIIMAGIRTATVMTVGIATIAAFIGAGGLGNFIYQGMALNDNALILLGAIPAAIMALLLDFLLGRLERRLQSRHRRLRLRPLTWIISLIIIIALLIVSSIFLYGLHRKNTVVVASKNFTEQIILADMITDMIKTKTQLHVIQKLNLGSTAVCQQAMLKGEIDIYPEYTGTAYLTVLKLPYQDQSAQALYNIVKQQYQQQYHIAWLAPFGFENSQSVIITQAYAKQHQINTISQLTPYAPQLTIAAAPEFVKRVDGYPMLEKKYHIHFKAVKSMQPDLMYTAIHNGEVGVIMGYSSDGRIPAYHLQILKDDKHAFPPYYAAPLVRDSILKKYPQIKTALQPLAGLIDDKTMQHLNYRVNMLHQDPATVAQSFLHSKGLL